MTGEPQETVQKDSGNSRSRTPYMAIYVLLAAAFMAILNETVMSVAIPVVKADLGISAATAGWLTTSFLLTMAVIIPTTGFLVGAFRLRTLFAVCQGLFVVGTAIGIFATTFPVVIAARIVQASGTAVLLPLLMTTVLNLVPENERGRMMGRLTVVIAVAPAIGPTISGLILELSNRDWHALFETMLPLGLAVLIGGMFLLPKAGEKSHKHVDILSVLLSAGSFGPLVYALSRIGANFGAMAATMAVVGTVLLVWFTLRQVELAKTDRALLDLRTFKTPSFRVSSIILSVSFMMMFGVIIILPLYLSLRGVEIKTIGLMLMPGPLIMGLMGPAVGRLFDKYGARPLAVPGAIALTLGVFGLGFITMSTPLWWIVACHIVFEIGLGFLFTPLFTFGLGDLPRNLYPDGSAITNTLQQVFGAVGTALFVALSSVATAIMAPSGAETAAAPEVVRGYSAAMFVAAAIGLGVVALTFRIKRSREKVQLR